MRKVRITDIADTAIKGVTVVTERDFDPYKEDYFVWKATPLVAHFQSSEVSGGVLRAWKHTPVFSELETHDDDEGFFFVAGTALMAAFSHICPCRARWLRAASRRRCSRCAARPRGRRCRC